MSSKKKVFEKGCGVSKDCKSYPTFKVSSCPLGLPISQGEPEPSFIPVYGSLSSTGFNALPNTNINFDGTGLHNGVTPDISDDSITVNSPGVYSVSFSTNIIILYNLGDYKAITFCLSINGIPDNTRQIVIGTTFDLGAVKFTSIARTDQLTLSENDVLRVFIPSMTGNDIIYTDAALVVTKVA